MLTAILYFLLSLVLSGQSSSTSKGGLSEKLLNFPLGILGYLFSLGWVLKACESWPMAQPEPGTLLALSLISPACGVGLAHWSAKAVDPKPKAVMTSPTDS